MKFDFVIGNPPYQENKQGNERANPIYDKFMEEAFKVAKAVELITPARFLFEAGQTSKEWNKKMLNDKHFKVLYYESDSSKIFSNTTIMGGVAITYRDEKNNYGAIGTFTPHENLNSIIAKVASKLALQESLASIVTSQGLYRFSALALQNTPQIKKISGAGTGSKIISSIMDRLPSVFSDQETVDCLKMYGRISGKRGFKYIRREFIEENDYIDTFNVLVPEGNGCSPLGAGIPTPVLGTTFVIEPHEGSADTFLTVGKFKTKYEAEALHKDIKTKFLRVLVGAKKVTQHNPKSTWVCVPLQDFSKKSDINWKASLANIDKQLYKKYSLTDEEVSFIETNVKEME